MESISGKISLSECHNLHLLLSDRLAEMRRIRLSPGFSCRESAFSEHDRSVRKCRVDLASVRRVLAHMLYANGCPIEEVARALDVAQSTAKNYRGSKFRPRQSDYELVNGLIDAHRR